MYLSRIGQDTRSQQGDRLAELCRKAVRGNRRAESRLLAEIYPRVSYYLRRHCWIKSAVDDHVQSTMEILVRSVRSGSVKQPEKVLEYAFGIARKRLLSYCRKMDRLCMDGGDEVALHDETESDPLAELITLETRQFVRHSLSKLPVARDRSLLGARYLAEKSSRAVAREFGISTDHVHRVLFRARQRLRQQIDHPTGDLERPVC